MNPWFFMLLIGNVATLAATPLPASLYFIKEGQIFRIEPGGINAYPVTRCVSPVDGFDVSPIDSSLVFVSGNTLFISDATGKNVKDILTGPKLSVPADEVTRLNDRASIGQRIASPRWSPDGTRIAFIRNGLLMIDVATSLVSTVHANDPISESSKNSLVIDAILSWSPDSSCLAVSTYRYPATSRYGMSLSLKKLEGTLVELTTGADFTLAWNPDGNEAFVAMASQGGACSLMRLDVAGMRLSCIGEDVPARSSFFYLGPSVHPRDGIRVFVGQSHSPVMAPDSFIMSRIRPDGYGRVEIRPERWKIQSAVWAGDGSGAAVIETDAAGDGRLLWIPASADTMRILAVKVSGPLHWGRR